jgi:hypothetical protein
MHLKAFVFRSVFFLAIHAKRTDIASVHDLILFAIQEIGSHQPCADRAGCRLGSGLSVVSSG